MQSVTSWVVVWGQSVTEHCQHEFEELMLRVLKRGAVPSFAGFAFCSFPLACPLHVFRFLICIMSVLASAESVWSPLPFMHNSPVVSVCTQFCASPFVSPLVSLRHGLRSASVPGDRVPVVNVLWLSGWLLPCWLAPSEVHCFLSCIMPGLVIASSVWTHSPPPFMHNWPVASVLTYSSIASVYIAAFIVTGTMLDIT